MRVGFVDQELLLKNLKNLGFYPKTVIDVGVANGTPWLYEAFPDSYFMLFEPVESFKPAIDKILSNITGELFPYALGAKHETKMIYIPNDEGMHQIATLHFEESVVSSDTKSYIDIVTLDSIFEKIEGDISHPIILKTDCQGHDLEVAKGALKSLDKIDVVITEVPLYGPWGGGDELKDYLDFYYDNNFILYDMVEPLRRPDDDKLHSIDLCLVNLNSPIAEKNLYTSGKETIKNSIEHYKSK